MLATLLLWWAADAARRLVSADAPAERRAAASLGAALSALVLVDPTLLPTALALLAWCGFERRARVGAAVALRALAPLVAAVAIVLVWRRLSGAHSPLPGELAQGLDGLVLSTGKSLFVYAPPLLLAPPALVWLWRHRRAHARLVLVVAAALLLAVARLDDWHGDPTWGPRRALPLVPLLLEPVALAWAAGAARLRRALLGVTAAAGLWVQLVGLAIAPQQYLDVIDQVRVASGAASWFAETPSGCHFIPQLSPVVGHSWLLSHLVRRDRRFDIDPPYLLLLDRPPKLDSVGGQLYIDCWVRDWPPLAAGVWLSALGAVVVSAFWTMRRRLV
jgi:hypothetical protein